MASEYDADCPFCERTIRMGASEFPYTSTYCTRCGAKLLMDNSSRQVGAVIGLPETNFTWTAPSRGEFDGDRFESESEVYDHLAEVVQDDPEDWFRVEGPVVDRETIQRVLHDGVHGDAEYHISGVDFTPGDLAEYGVEVA